MAGGIWSNAAEGTVRQGTAVVWAAALWLASWIFWGSSLQAEILYDQDGIQLQGTARVVAYNAATCRVLEESHTEARYEELKANDGQPLHVWQLDFSAYNGTGKPLSYLRADFDIESQYPPCTNWTGEGPGGGASGGPYTGGVQWGNQSRTLSTTAGMGVGEAKQGVLYLAVFHTDRPSYRRWSAHFTFGEPDRAGGGPGGTSPSDRARPAPAPEPRKAEPARNESGPDQAPGRSPGEAAALRDGPKCAEQPKGTSCWMELASQPGCHVWNPNLQPDETVTWTGECAEGVAQGAGTLKWVWDGGEQTSESTGGLQAGKHQGNWVMRTANGGVSEGPYVEGKRHGRWVLRAANGGVFEGPYVEGKRHGLWVMRTADGRRGSAIFENGKRVD